MPAKYYKPGVKPLTDAQYAKLPKVNLDTLSKYSTTARKFALKSILASGNITMLNTPPVGDQGFQGSCVGWAAGYAATGILTYPKYNCWSMSMRSPNYVYNQIKLSSDCLVGSFMIDGLNLVKTQGDCSWDLMPYLDWDCSTLPNSVQRYNASKNNALNWYSLDRSYVDGIKQVLDLGYPVPVVLPIYESFDDMWDSNGIWSTIYGKNRGLHATCIIGYDDSKQMFKVLNSWGYGGDPNNPGFFWITYSMIKNSCLSEVYVIYGMNPAYPESINGPTTICSTGATFSIDNLSSGCSVTWTSSSNLNPASAMGNPVTFTANGSGSGWVQATFSSSCGSITIPPKTIWVGSPISPAINGEPTIPCGGGELYTEDSRMQVQWSISSPFRITGGSFGSKCNIQAPSESAIAWLYATATNTCGSTRSEFEIRVNCVYYSVFPNPANSDITISRTSNGLEREGNNDKLIESIRVIDKFGNTLYFKKYDGETIESKFSVSDYQTGIYIVRINEGLNSEESHTIAKN